MNRRNPSKNAERISVKFIMKIVKSERATYCHIVGPGVWNILKQTCSPTTPRQFMQSVCSCVFQLCPVSHLSIQMWKYTRWTEDLKWTSGEQTKMQCSLRLPPSTTFDHTNWQNDFFHTDKSTHNPSLSILYQFFDLCLLKKVGNTFKTKNFGILDWRWSEISKVNRSRQKIVYHCPKCFLP